MTETEKIITILEKESLSEQDEQFLQKAGKENEGSKKLIEAFRSLKSDLENSTHIDDDLLSSYLLLNEGNEPEQKIVIPLKKKISDHLENCLACSERYKFMKTEYFEAATYLSKTFEGHSANDRKVDSFLVSSLLNRFGNFKYAFASVIVIFVLYIGLYAVSSLSTPMYKKNLFSEQNSDFYKTRGRTSIEFQKALDALEKNNLSDATSYLQQDIMDHSNESSIFYSYYILGLSYLKSAESNFLGLFNNFDNEKVRFAIENLEKSIAKNKTGNHENLNLDAHYYLGRSYQLLSEKENAKHHLLIVIENKGKFYNEALSSIEQLDN